jgi:hypothetical protein
MVYEETDDMIGMGDFASFLRKARKIGKKVRGVVKKVRSRVKRLKGKARKARGIVREEVEATRRTVDPRGGRPVAVAPGGGMPGMPGASGAMDWIKANPMIVAGGALAAVFLFARRK